MKVKLTVNGHAAEVETAPLKRLLDVLREDLSLTGSKEGCGEGECGACTVLIDGAAVNSCLVPIYQCDGTSILSVEGLAGDHHLHPLQACFLAEGGAQCGICTPGMLMAAKALLDGTPEPSDEEIRVGIAGNLCRCTGYEKILTSVREAARRLREGQA